MLVRDYLQTITEPIGKRTLCFLTDENNRVLLGMKKTGFGKGNYLGIGGKLEEGETIEEATIREMQEEVGVTLTDFQKMAVMTFLFQGRPHHWNQEVHIFKTDKWEGDLHETDEINPRWFDIQEILFDSMWKDNRYWLPKILNGEKAKGIFLFDENLKVIDYEIGPY